MWVGCRYCRGDRNTESKCTGVLQRAHYRNVNHNIIIARCIDTFGFSEFVFLAESGAKFLE